jgi:hypothetical protein
MWMEEGGGGGVQRLTKKFSAGLLFAAASAAALAAAMSCAVGGGCSCGGGCLRAGTGTLPRLWLLSVSLLLLLVPPRTGPLDLELVGSKLDAGLPRPLPTPPLAALVGAEDDASGEGTSPGRVV